MRPLKFILLTILLAAAELVIGTALGYIYGFINHNILKHYQTGWSIARSIHFVFFIRHMYGIVFFLPLFYFGFNNEYLNLDILKNKSNLRRVFIFYFWFNTAGTTLIWFIFLTLGSASLPIFFSVVFLAIALSPYLLYKIPPIKKLINSL